MLVALVLLLCCEASVCFWVLVVGYCSMCGLRFAVVLVLDCGIADGCDGWFVICLLACYVVVWFDLIGL